MRCARRPSRSRPASSGSSSTISTRMERSEEHTSELQSRLHLVCRLLLEKKKKKTASYGVVKIITSEWTCEIFRRNDLLSKDHLHRRSNSGHEPGSISILLLHNLRNDHVT